MSIREHCDNMSADKEDSLICVILGIHKTYCAVEFDVSAVQVVTIDSAFCGLFQHCLSAAVKRDEYIFQVIIICLLPLAVT